MSDYTNFAQAVESIFGTEASHTCPHCGYPSYSLASGCPQCGEE